MKDNIYSTVAENFQKAAERLGLEETIIKKLSIPKEKIEICITPKLAEGIVSTVAYIVRFSDTLGPSKGGLRMAPDLTCEDIVGLAMEMTWKTAIIHVPFGGGKSGIALDPTSLSPEDKEVVVRSFTRNAKRHIGPEIYIPAPDMGTNETDMGHISDCISFSEGVAITRGCFVTGKPQILGGIAGRKQATGRGVCHCIRAAAEKLGLSIKDMSFVIQGFGNVGAAAAHALAREGGTITAVADIFGAICNENGLNVRELDQHVCENNTVVGFSESEEIGSNEIFQLECDCLLPAAASEQITSSNAAGINARIIAEGANSPTTPGADAILDEKDIFIIPDILCNAGGVFVSYLEYVQQTQHEQIGETEVNSRLAERMNRCFHQTYDYSQKNRCSMRQAALDIAIRRVVEGTYSRGFHP